MWNQIKSQPNDQRYQHTLREILQQPSCWLKTAEIVLKDEALKAFLSEALADINRPIIVSGAGSSEFVGQSVIQALTKHTSRRVINAPTTDIVTNPGKFNIPNHPALMISFARSGNSPESVASVDLIKKICPSTKHLIITCNKDGNLAKSADKNTYVILLPEETNDVSLVMTSSFSSMVLASVLIGVPTDKGLERTRVISECITQILDQFPDKIASMVVDQKIDRVQFLGTNDAKGVLTEAHLKMIEMTDGKVATRIDSFLGVRHGPQVFTTKNTLVFAILSSDEYIRSYEIDLLNEMKNKKQGSGFIVVGEGSSKLDLPNLLAIETPKLCDCFNVFLAIPVFQLLGLFKSLAVELSPDAPSSSGTINRVVQGVTIYPFA
ncbi:MAG: SIS domain-containing protein [Brevinema sp.]